MPLTIPVGDGTVAWHHRVAGDNEDMVCTMGVRAVSAPLGTAHVQRLGDAWVDSVMLQLASSLTLLKVELRVRQDGGGDVLYVWNAPGGSTGGQTFAGASQNVAYLVHKTTARAGKRGRGRFYVPGVTEDRVNPDGTIPTASLTAVQGAFGSFLLKLADPPLTSGLLGDPVIPLLFHGNTTETNVTTGPNTRTTTVTTGAAGPAPDVITGLSVDGRVATQRRRLR